MIMAMERPLGWKDGAPPITPEACAAAAEFAEAAVRAYTGLPIPEVSPSPMGGVTLSWWFDGIGFLARIYTESGDVYFQQEGPDFRVQTGTEPRDAVLARIAALSRLA
jgi:hypothetical protein